MMCNIDYFYLAISPFKKSIEIKSKPPMTS